MTDTSDEKRVFYIRGKRHEYVPTEEHIKLAQTLIHCGYRRTSNGSTIVTRIDREDWIQILATKLRRAPADFYVPGDPEPAGNWCDWFRRCVSEDSIWNVPHEIFHLIPGSGHDDCGYCEVDKEDTKIIARLRRKLSRSAN